MTFLRTGQKIAAVTLLIAALSSPVLSQEGTGVRGTLSFSQGLEIEDSDFLTRTGLGFGITSATRAETFSFTLGTELIGDSSDDADKEFSFANQDAQLRYTRQGANSRLDFSALYTEVELDDEVVEGIGGTSLISSGAAETKSVNLGLEFGVEGPLGVSLDFSRRDVSYFDTLDPELNDFKTTSLDALANFRIRPSLSLRTRAGIERTDEEDGLDTSTEDSYVGLGVESTTASGLTIIGDVLYDRSETTIAGPIRTTEEGLGIELTVRQDRPNGTIELAMASRIDEDGRRTSAEVKRGYQLRNGAVALSLGVVDQENDDTLRLIGGVSLERDTRRGTLSANVTQEASTSDGNPVLNTNLDLELTQSINSVSSWSAGIGFVSTDEQGGTYENRSTATISYTRDLTAEWDLNAGVEYSKDRGESASNTFFLNIRRDFTFGF